MTQRSLASRVCLYHFSLCRRPDLHRMKNKLILCHIAAWSMVAHSFAQTAPAPSGSSATEEPVKLEAFTVTGSNIKRLEIEKVLPVTILDAAAIEVRDGSQPS